MTDDTSATPPSLRPMLSFNQGELDEMRRNMKEWLDNPTLFAQWMREQSIIHLQVLNKLVLNPPGGRNGAKIAALALRDFTNAAAKILPLLQGAGSNASEPVGGDPGAEQPGAQDRPKRKAKKPAA